MKLSNNCQVFFLPLRLVVIFLLILPISNVSSQDTDYSDLIILDLIEAETFDDAESTDTIISITPVVSEEPVELIPAKPITADDIDTLLQTRAITYEQAVWLILRVAEIPNIGSSAEAYLYAISKDLLPSDGIKPQDAARLDNLSFLIMRTYNLKGGIMYRLRKTPRYAYRELLYMNIISGRVDPAMKVSGEQLLYYIHNILTRQEEGV
jgi:hypothetical protein